MPIKDAPIGVPCQVEGEVIHQEVTFKPRKQLIVQIADGSGSVLFLRFIHFYASNQKQMAVGKRIRAVGEIKHGFHGRRDDSSQNPRCREQRFGGKPHADLSDRKWFEPAHFASHHSDGVGRYAATRHAARCLIESSETTAPCRKPAPFAFRRRRVSPSTSFPTARCLHGSGSNSTNF